MLLNLMLLYSYKICLAVCPATTLVKSLNNSINQSINQSVFRVAYVTNSYHKDHTREKVNLEDKAMIGEWKKMQF